MTDSEIVLTRRIDELCADNERLRGENAKLRKLCGDIWSCARLLQANKHIDGMRISDKFREECERSFDELGIEVNSGKVL